MKAWVDPDRCRGHGICVSIDPEVFQINEDGYSEVQVSEIPPGHEERVREAIKQCPEHAIQDITDAAPGATT